MPYKYSQYFFDLQMNNSDEEPGSDEVDSSI